MTYQQLSQIDSVQTELRNELRLKSVVELK